MGISLYFYRVSTTLLDELIALQDEEAVYNRVSQGSHWFPYTLHKIWLGKIGVYGELEYFLNPTRDRSSIFWKMFHGTRPVTQFLSTESELLSIESDTEYLNVLYYFTPEEVCQMTDAMLEIEYLDLYNRYEKLYHAQSQAEQPKATNCIPFQPLQHLFLQTLCFCHIAKQAGDIILRSLS